MMRNIEKIVKNGLCTSCGVCTVACPKRCISLESGNKILPVINRDKCIECGLCLKVCPGKGVNLKEMGADLFPDSKVDSFAGRYLNCYASFSLDPDIRFHSSSGGVVSQFLIYLLEKNIITGALVVKYSDDNPFVPKSFIARTKQEILSSRGSKYLVVSVSEALLELKDSDKIVVVGLPCQIQGVRNLAKINKRIANNIIGYFGLFCSCTKINSSTDYYLYRYNVNKNACSKFSFRDDGCYGFMKFVGKDGAVLKRIPYQKYWKGTRGFFVNDRCSLCTDHFAELAEVSFGDSDHQPYAGEHIGISSLVVRSVKWNELLLKAMDESFLFLEKVTIEEVVSKQVYAKFYKKGKGVKAALFVHKLLGNDIPKYGDLNNSKVDTIDVLKAIARVFMKKAGKFKILWPFIKLLDRQK